MSQPAAGSQAVRFEYWDDRHYRTYGDADQHFLAVAAAATPCPPQVDLPNGRYTVVEFDKVPWGEAYQLNVQTGWKRHVRLVPPYQVAGLPSASLPAEFHFIFEDRDQWKPFNQRLQQELQQLARCTPPPAQTYFAEESGVYILHGLSSLTTPTVRLVQENLKTKKKRVVRIVPGPVPPTPSRGFSLASGYGGSSASLAVAPPPAAPFSHPLFAIPSMLQALLPGGGGGGGSAPSRRPQPPPEAFSVRMVKFAACQRGQPSSPLDAALQEILVTKWREKPRVSTVELPNGQKVENFDLLELGRAELHLPGGDGGVAFLRQSRPTWTPLELVVPVLAPGLIRLPEQLDDQDGPLDMSVCGRALSPAEVAALGTDGEPQEPCPICFSEIKPGDGTAFQLQCGHTYHGDCIERWFKEKRSCPKCMKTFGKVVGKQPKVGQMRWSVEDVQLAGYERVSSRSIVVVFEFPDGREENGTQYKGRQPRCYLPDNSQGALLLELFKVAFRRRVMFGLGDSMTYGCYRPTYNVHIKTSTHRGAAGHGYPDPDYVKRALQELQDNGVTAADLPP